MDYNELERIMLEVEPDSIFEDEDGINVTTEWLVGKFAGRAFTSNNKIEALKQMCDYFDKHINNDSIVGNIVTSSGWPNLSIVEHFLKNN